MKPIDIIDFFNKDRVSFIELKQFFPMTELTEVILNEKSVDPRKYVKYIDYDFLKKTYNFTDSDIEFLKKDLKENV